MNRLMRSTCLQVMVLACLSASLGVKADYVWLEPGRDGANAFLGLHDAAIKADIAVLNSSRAFVVDDKELALQKENNHFVIAPAEGDIRLTAQAVTQGEVLNFYQAKLGRSETKAVNDLELVPIASNGNTFKLVWKGSAVAASQVNVSTSEGWIRSLKPAEDGTVTLKTSFPGLYVLEVTARINGSTTYQGKKYEDVRHTATLSFEVPQ
ncbi:hypothetical protein [Methylophilus sp. OH31]|uniref:hypothetical protein n=1 Tax=Methylophilus sp. OH31 TaxID=1387312 RepID=UPI0004B997EC|nr:hypothetical protein [Methylophilus sp. OH31]